MGITDEELVRMANGPPSKFAMHALIEELKDWKVRAESRGIDRDNWERDSKSVRAELVRLEAYGEQLSKDIEQSGTPEAGLRIHGFHTAAALIASTTAEIMNLRTALERLNSCPLRCASCSMVIDKALAAKGGAT